MSSRVFHSDEHGVRFALIISLLCVLGSMSLFGQSTTKGVIAGKIRDKASHEELVGANVVVKGTYFGAVSDVDGNFRIIAVTPGTYVVDVSLLGFKTVEYAAVKVNVGDTTKLSVEMEETVLSLGQEIVIIGEKPLFNIEETQSTQSMSHDQIKAAAVQSVQDIVGLQAGVVQSDNEIHIRGGRTYENAYLLDGISVQDQLAGTGFGLQLSPSAIQDVEVISGGYNAEYGQATSGIVKVTTKEGSSNYSGSWSYKRDHFGFNQNSLSNANTDIYEGSLSGPEPITTYLLPLLDIHPPGTVSFFGSLYGNLTDGYTRWIETLNQNGAPVGYQVSAPTALYSSLIGNSFFSPRRSNNWSGIGKITWKPSSVIKLSYTLSGSLVIDQNTQTIQQTLDYVQPNPGYQYAFQNIPDSALTFTQINIQHSLSFTHTLSPKTFYELKFSLYTARVRGDANGLNYNQYTSPKDIVTFPISYYNLHSDTIKVIPGDGFYDIGNPSEWTDHYLREYTAKGDLTSFFSETQKFKTGFELRFQSLQMVDIEDPWIKPLGLNYDIYSVNPAQGAFYAQDNVTLKGMILNAGLRLDYWFPGSFVDSVLSLPVSQTNISSDIQKAYFNDTYNLFGHRWKARLSPRLGISHPISDNQSLFFSYGHFSKLPRPQYVYSKLAESGAQSTYQTIGNPDLNPETTVAYELGLRQQFSEGAVLTITAYYKDIFDYITAASVNATNSRFVSGLYTTYINQDYSRVRGVEFEYKTRLITSMEADLSGSYSVATGKSSTADEELNNIHQGLSESIKEEPAIYDRPLQLSLNINYKSKPNEPLFGFGRGVLDNYNVFVRIFYESGMRYTPELNIGTDPLTGRVLYITDNNNPYTDVGTAWFWVDLNFEKYFNLSFSTLTFSAEIQNLLNNQNSQIINPVTGRAYQYGDPVDESSNDPRYPQLTAPVSTYPYNPARYLTPRTFRLGLSMSF